MRSIVGIIRELTELCGGDNEELISALVCAVDNARVGSMWFGAHQMSLELIHFMVKIKVDWKS